MPRSPCRSRFSLSKRLLVLLLGNTLLCLAVLPSSAFSHSFLGALGGDVDGTTQLKTFGFFDPLPWFFPEGGGYLTNADGTAKAQAMARERSVFGETRVSHVEGEKWSRKARAVAFLSETFAGSLTPRAIMFIYDVESLGLPTNDSGGSIQLGVPNKLTQVCGTPLRKKKWLFWKVKGLNGLVSYIQASPSITNENNQPREAFVSIRYRVYQEGERSEISLDNPCGVKLYIYNDAGGFRVVREKAGQKGFTGGCWYAPGGYYNPYWDNESFNTRGRFLWVNYELNPDFKNDAKKSLRTDAYIYDPCDDKLVRYSYGNWDDFNRDKEKIVEFAAPREFITYEGAPPAKAEDLDPHANKAVIIAPSFVKERTADDPEVEMTYTPGVSLSCVHTSNAEWRYELVGSRSLGGIVAPGDSITISGPAVAGGHVEGDAATVAYGAWQVRESTAGRVVFAASTAAAFIGPADGFVLQARPGSAPGEIPYRTTGDWIGGSGVGPGPAMPGTGNPELILLLD